MVQDRAEAAHEPAGLKVLGGGEERFGGLAQPLSHVVKGSGNQGQVFLKFPDRVFVILSERNSFVPALGGVFGIAVGTVVNGRSLFLDHVEVDTNLEEADRGHHAIAEGFGVAPHHFHGGFQVVVTGNCQGEPKVEVGTFTGVIVADAGMLVDAEGTLMQFVRLESHGHQSCFVTQAAGVEDGA